MSGRNVTIGVIILIIVIVGGWFIYSKTSGAPTSATSTSTSTSATSTPQVQAQDVTVGTGTEAMPGDVVSVLYVGKLSSGTVFDDSQAHGNVPFAFTLGCQSGNGCPIPGFQIGVNGMKVGGERIMSIPPELGYQAQAVTDASGTVIIPANSTLLFDVKLVGVTQGTSTPTTTQ